VESSCECGYEPSGSIKDGKLSSGYMIGGLSSSSQFHTVSSFGVGNHVAGIIRTIEIYHPRVRSF
jgi:hypothetical protein